MSRAFAAILSNTQSESGWVTCRVGADDADAAKPVSSSDIVFNGNIAKLIQDGMAFFKFPYATGETSFSPGERVGNTISTKEKAAEAPNPPFGKQ